MTAYGCGVFQVLGAAVGQGLHRAIVFPPMILFYFIKTKITVCSIFFSSYGVSTVYFLNLGFLP